MPAAAIGGWLTEERVMPVVYRKFDVVFSKDEIKAILSVTVATFLADIIDLLLGFGCRAHLRLHPCPSARPG
jgi:hypothetical protein